VQEKAAHKHFITNRNKPDAFEKLLRENESTNLKFIKESRLKPIENKNNLKLNYSQKTISKQ